MASEIGRTRQIKRATDQKHLSLHQWLHEDYVSTQCFGLKVMKGTITLSAKCIIFKYTATETP